MSIKYRRRHLRPVVATVTQTAYQRGQCDRAEHAEHRNPYTHCDDRADYERGYHAPVDLTTRRTVLGPSPSAANRYAKFTPCRNSGRSAQ